MYSSLSRLSSSLVNRLVRCQGETIASRSFSVSRVPPGPLENFQQSFNSSENVSENGPMVQERSRNPSFMNFPGHVDNFQQGFSSSENSSMVQDLSGNSRSMNFQGHLENSQQGFNSLYAPRNSRSMNFVRGIIEDDGRGNFGSAQFPRYNLEQNADIVHIKLMKNNTFVTVTDSKGNKKLGASAGSLPEMKGGPKLSKYAAEATAEHVGRLARNFGVKSVVMKVKGFTYFKKKRQAIMSFKEGFTNSKVGQSPIVYIEDTTRKPHNGCRLPKKRRV